MTTPAEGEFRLHGHARPPVTAGPHRIRLTQTIDKGGAIAEVTRHAVVTAPQFALPPGELRSVFPPPEATGSFDTRLAQVALRRRTLPWERLLAPEDQERRPWLALVLLTENEGRLQTGVPVSTAVPAALHQTLGIGSASGSCDRLDTTRHVIQALFPRPDELGLLCHVREVSLADTELAAGDDDGFLAVVICARLPRPGVSYRAYLLSLEHRLADLPTTTGTPGVEPGAGPATPGGATVSFPVLAHWRFRCAPEPGDFESLARGLHVGALGTVLGDCPAVAPSGHVVIGHRTRRGEEGAAWYRGPLTPREVPRRPPGTPYLTADQARAFARDGLEDLSEAAAFELGRLLALSSPSFLIALRAWRRRRLAAAVAAAALQRVPAVTDLGLDPSSVAQGLGLAVIATLADPRAPLGEPVPVADAAWAIGDFPMELIAEGTGLSLSEVKRLLVAPELPASPRPPDALTALDQTFDGLRASPAQLAPLGDALADRVRQLAVRAGLDPATAVFDPAVVPLTLEELFP
ncbi:hypothetical protein [Nonomuraea sp. JJY05]|uniref:hypothetical protein n=1 Tax=Nonomuraea sp. JJY05 TaxID=3350255 RepID=UPI00373ED33D